MKCIDLRIQSSRINFPIISLVFTFSFRSMYYYEANASKHLFKGFTYVYDLYSVFIIPTQMLETYSTVGKNFRGLAI
jgi:hypothetical protein